MRRYPYFVSKFFRNDGTFDGADIDAHLPEGAYVEEAVFDHFFGDCEGNDKLKAAYLAQITQDRNGNEVWGWVGAWDIINGKQRISWSSVFGNQRWHDLKNEYKRKKYLTAEQFDAVIAEMKSIAGTENLDSVDLELTFIRNVHW